MFNAPNKTQLMEMLAAQQNQQVPQEPQPDIAQMQQMAAQGQNQEQDPISTLVGLAAEKKTDSLLQDVKEQAYKEGMRDAVNKMQARNVQAPASEVFAPPSNSEMLDPASAGIAGQVEQVQNPVEMQPADTDETTQLDSNKIQAINEGIAMALQTGNLDPNDIPELLSSDVVLPELKQAIAQMAGLTEQV